MKDIEYRIAETSISPVLVAASDRGVCRLAFGEGAGDLRARFPSANLREGGELIDQLLSQVVEAIEYPGNAHAIPLDLAGTPFQLRVWQALRAIPAGQTRSYGEIATALGNAKASRAVGGANGANSIAVLVPCHRVIAADGSLGGYAFGLEIKAELLRRENLATRLL